MLQLIGSILVNSYRDAVMTGEGYATTELEMRSGWPYNAEALSDFLYQLSQKTGIPISEYRRTQEFGGGKALGLEVCGAIADRVSSLGLTVPPWAVDKEKKALISDPVSRISSYDADWLDSSAGNKEHRTCGFAQESVRGEHAHLAMMVDVGYSSISGRRVVRLTSGYAEAGGNGPYAPAISDPDVIVFGQGEETPLCRYVPSINKRTFLNHSGIPLEHKVSFCEFISKELPEILDAIGMTFDSQLEIVYADGKFNLVQARPAPGQIYGPERLENLSSESSSEGGARVLSPLVTGAFKRERLRVINVRMGENGGEILKDGEGAEFPDFESSCVVVHDPRSNPREYLRLLESLPKTATVISTAIIGPNTKHGPYDDADFAVAQEDIPLLLCGDLKVPMVGLRREDLESLQGCAFVTVRSDGYLAEIRV